MSPQNFNQGSRTLGPTGTRIVGLFFILIGIPIVYITYGMIFGPSIAANWTVLKGTILSANVSTVSTYHTASTYPNNYMYIPNVVYSYVINGTRYTSSNIYPSNNNFGYSTGQQAEAVIQNYTVGESVNVYYNPTESITALTTKSNGTANTLTLIFFIGGVLAILMGVLALVFANR